MSTATLPPLVAATFNRTNPACFTYRQFFLHISKDEQKKRLEGRLASPEKTGSFRWQTSRNAIFGANIRMRTQMFSPSAVRKWASWYIIPADHKWYRNWIVARIIVEKPDSLDLKYPPPKEDLSRIRIQ